MLRCHFCLLAILVVALSKDALFLTTEQKQKCIRQFLNWCKKNTYNTEEEDVVGSVSVYSTDFRRRNVRIYCTMDDEGTECLKDKKPWYHCLPDNSLTYQGVTLGWDTTDVDDDICLTKKCAVDSGYHTRFNKTAFKIEMSRFRQRMTSFQKNLRKNLRKNLQKNLQRNLREQLSGIGKMFL